MSKARQNAKHDYSTLDIAAIKEGLDLNNKQLAFMWRVSHRSVDRWLRQKQPQPAWLFMVHTGAQQLHYGGYGTREALITAYDVNVGNKKANVAADVESL